MRINFKSISLVVVRIVCVFMMVSAISGCGGENVKDQLVGKWERNWSSEEISSPLLNSGSIVMKGREEIKFDDAGNYTTHDTMEDTDYEDTDTGTYSIENDKTLKISYDDGRVFTYKYDESAKSGSEDKWFLSGDKLYKGTCVYDRM